MHGYAGVDSKVTSKQSYLRALKETFFLIHVTLQSLPVLRNFILNKCQMDGDQKVPESVTYYFNGPLFLSSAAKMSKYVGHAIQKLLTRVRVHLTFPRKLLINPFTSNLRICFFDNVQ